MLTDSQRDALTLRLRQGRRAGDGEIGRRGAGLTELPLSFGQEQLWFLDRFAPGLLAYNIPQALRLSGRLDRAALERALGGLIARHEALRTRLVPGPGGRPVQVIDPPATPSLELADLAGFAPGKWQDRLAELIRADAMQPFDLAAGPLVRTWLARLDESEHVLAFIAHHTVFDGWSAKVLVSDLAALYRSEVTGEPCQLAELPVQFADYAVWERERLHGESLAPLADYWRQALAGAQTLQFPADRPRPAIDNFDGALATAMTDAGLLAGLRELSRRESVTLFAAVTAGLLALLHRYSGQDDLVVGTVSANRSRAELEPLIGFLVNTLPIRCDVSGDPSFAELLQRVKNAILGGFAHQDLPFGKLVDVLGVARDASRAPVFQIALAFAERDDTPVPAAGLEFATSDLVAGIEAAKFDLTFTVQARPGGLWTECCYKTALFDAGTVQRLLGHWETLLRGVVAQPSARLSQLPLLTAAELRAELSEWNDTDGVLPQGCAHELFEAQAARTPGAVAAIMADPAGDREQVSYAELNEQASHLAQRLRGLGVGPEHLVGVCMRTGLARLGALLGIWKAGGGYLPLDPALPSARLSFMIADAGLRVILTDRASRGSLPQSDGPGAARAVCLEDEAGQLRLPAGDLAGAGASPGNVAYVIYTSGSTGQPKGVVVEHGNLLNFVRGLAQRCGIGPGSTVLQFASVCFDASVMEMFLPLLTGGRVVLAPADTLHSPPQLAELLRRERVTFTLLPPAVLDLLPAGQYPDLKVLLTGGEELPSELARRWMSQGPGLVNAYGPTEATVIASCAELEPGTPLPPPIGRPMPNCQAYVLDGQLNPVPVGVTGELHIGGAGVARGYLNRPELTAERFIPDPFRPGGRLYKTGDLARRRPDGTLVFAGRVDSQVKIRGLRVELGEIEAALAAHPAVAQAVVTLVTGPAGSQQLAGYLRLRPPAAQPVADGTGSGLPSSLDQDVRSHLARVLPQAEIPDYLVAVSEFPLSHSGKIDRSALPAPVPSGAGSGGDAAPATLIELMLADIYASVLGRDAVGARDSFFDLGGNSLAAMRLVGELASELEVDVGVSAVFLAPSPRQLAAVLRDEHGLRDEELEDIDPGDLALPGSAQPDSARAASGP